MNVAVCCVCVCCQMLHLCLCSAVLLNFCVLYVCCSVGVCGGVHVCVGVCVCQYAQVHLCVFIMMWLSLCLCWHVSVRVCLWLFFWWGWRGGGAVCGVFTSVCTHMWLLWVTERHLTIGFVCPISSCSDLLCGLQVQVMGVAASCSTVSLSFTCDTRRSTRSFCLR